MKESSVTRKLKAASEWRSFCEVLEGIHELPLNYIMKTFIVNQFSVSTYWHLVPQPENPGAVD